MVSFDLRLPPSARSNGRNGRSPPWTHSKSGSHLVKMVWPYVWSIAAVAVAAGLGLVLIAQVPLPNVSMVFLLAVLFSAARFGIWPALFSSGLSFLAYNYLFIPPRQSFSVAEPHELLALFIFLAAAVLTSTIAGRARDQARRAAERAVASRRLYKFARRLSALADPQSVLEHAAIQAHGDLHRPCIILLREGDGLVVSAAWPPDDQLDPDVLSAAQLVLAKGEAASVGTTPGPAVRWLFLPLRTPEGAVGVIGLAQADDAPLDLVARTLFETLAELTATALERTRLGQEISAARTAAEAERIRNTLLASVSHDFRTPLASILGAATSLIEYGARLPEPARRDLLVQVKDEAEHLDGMVRNLLAMTRLEAGALEFNYDWIDLQELLDCTVATAKRRGAPQLFDVLVEKGLPFVFADPNLLEQVLANVVGNAIRYAGPGARIVLDAKREAETAVLSVTDDGPGITPEVLPRIFEKFARAPTPGDAGEGTGLGLAIVKGIVEAHQGTVAAFSPVADHRGTLIEIRMPLVKEGA
jgi:K+-sensing histidine kinase KdpD